VMSTHQDEHSVFVKTSPALKTTEIRLNLKTLIDLKFVAIHTCKSGGEANFRSKTTAFVPT